MTPSTPWDGRPPCEGWHWLRGRVSGDVKVAFWSRMSSWRVSDSIGRTVIRSELKVSKLFVYEHPITFQPPRRDARRGAMTESHRLALVAAQRKRRERERGLRE